MYLEFWGLEKKPFENTPNPEFFFPAEEHKEALTRMEYVIYEKKGAALLTGDYGCGKTMLVRKMASAMPHNNIQLAYLDNPRWDPEELLQEILFQLGEEQIPTDSLHLGRRIGDVIFSNTENGIDTVVIIDEAQLIQSEKVFDELRLLLNYQLNDRFMITLVMCGQPELRERVMAIPQLEQRMFLKYHLHNFDYENTIQYIEHRLKVADSKRPIFTDDAYEVIYRHSFGTPRRINNICDLSLLIGAQKKLDQIDSNFVKSLI